MISILLGVIVVLLLVLIYFQFKSQNEKKLDEETIVKYFDSLYEKLRSEFSINREEYQKSFKEQRTELENKFDNFSGKQQTLFEKFEERIDKNSTRNEARFDKFEERIDKSAKASEERFDKIEERVTGDLKEIRENNEKKLDEIRGTLENASKQQSDLFEKFEQRLNLLVKENDEKMRGIQKQIDEKLNEIRENNDKKLEEMRKTVDEKLHDTLEKRLGESFKLVSEQLENVSKGLGEMRNLATGVGDLKRVLTNVKTRGTWGEVQLEKLIEEVLTPEQYAKNIETKKGSRKRVEFAIKMPGNSRDESVWMPVDAKFPLEDYQRLKDAQEKANMEEIERAKKMLQERIKQQAKEIQEKYLNPPETTEFAIMFLPMEGLYAEVLSIPGLFDFVQRNYRVTMTGPTNFLALLNSLQMGFRTLAIQKRSSEVWKLLGVVKTEFGKFGNLLEKTQLKLSQASKQIEDAARKSRTIERKLRNVEALPTNETNNLLSSGEEDIVVE